MSLAVLFPAAILETILTRLAVLFLTGAGGDATIARQAASEMIAAYRPQTHDELYLAANIISFGFQALEALGQAADPEMPLTRVLRLRGSAVSLSREGDKARRTLCQLQKARQEVQSAPQPEQPEAARPAIVVQPPIVTAGPQAEEDRQRDLRIAAGLKRMEARIAATSEVNGKHVDGNALPSGAHRASAASGGLAANLTGMP